MIRGVTSVVLTLGILLCPLYCGQGVHAVAAATPTACSGDCCGCDGPAGEGKSRPAPCHDGCSCDCLCKGLLGGHVKFFLASTHGWLLVCGERRVVLPASRVRLPETLRPRSPTHPGLSSGVAIRLAFASWLV